ncbi:hypothetical protein DFH06DRAFT_1032888 [Mycena polygramma]|nr:hypothetical protein DFH06DRAFT_1032888 [Mycena polygramma]
MPALGPYSCWIEVDGVRLPEYSSEYSADGREATCWIPSEVNKKFSIHWTDSKASATRQVYGFVAVDGHDCGGYPLILVRAGSQIIGTGHRDSVRASQTTRRPLIFGRQELTDDDRFLDTSLSPDLGTITLKLDHVNRYRTAPTLRHFASIPSRQSKLHERSKKAIGHSVRLGAEFRSLAPSHMVDDTALEILESLAQFTFRYRPLDLLKANGIAPAEKPRLARPAAAEVVPDEEDEEAISAKIKVLQDKLAVVRKKPQTNRVKKEVKAETSFFLPGEVIDLT